MAQKVNSMLYHNNELENSLHTSIDASKKHATP